MTRHWRFTPEVSFGMLLAALGVVAISGSIALGLGRLEQPGPGLFPLFTGLATLASSIIVTASAWRRAPHSREPIFEPGALRTLSVLAASFVSWIVFMPLTGFVIVTFLCVMALAKAFGLEGWLKPTLLASATACGIYVLFDRMLYLDLPTGPWS